MMLATLPNGTPDGQLVLVSSDHRFCLPATGTATTLQDALERWSEIEPKLLILNNKLATGSAENIAPLTVSDCLAPLPRAWQWLDGSAFESHGDLMQAVFNLPPNPKGRPLMYQGLSDRWLPPTADVPMRSEEDGIDFEGEFGVIVDAVPQGVTAEQAARHVRLVVQINDWSLRTLAPIEMKTGFGWIQAKPACSMAPVAITPDELGSSWRDGRVDVPLMVKWNGKKFGAASGYPMAWSLAELVAHAAGTRDLVAGTIIGTGTVSNPDFRDVGSSCIAEKRGIETIDEGKARTEYMKFGDRVQMEARLPSGAPLFGAIDQRVVRYSPKG